MIAEHSAYLSWAVHEDGALPRIPHRRIKDGGFAPLLKRPEARAAVRHWWTRVLHQLRN